MTDGELLRFCRARKFDITKTIEMYSNMLEWKKEENLEHVCQREVVVGDSKETLRKLYPTGFLGVDKLGRPLKVERVGMFKVPELLGEFGEDQAKEFFFQDFELLHKMKFLACSDVYDRQIC